MSTLRDALRDLSDDVFFDLLESDDAYLLVLDVPGATPESVSVSVAEETIAIEARREKLDDGEYRYLEENRPLLLDVELPLPDDAASETATAVERGVLELTVPKRPADGSETPLDSVERENAG
ncbi:Hsp20/alpha crystallin family protein [Natronococcus sp. A-GB1]|uniref:Heat shock protein Hsp20 n=1 Tax=Natronococcus amylolyticus DSM 10524 TaxID=1227497 RepID=L9X6C4_9EURY|nr:MULTISPECIES: Hsp20/alpha crystallin family protein [Natronococcus]ELY57157.1 heat shock protein Hsp20 [Natronococcus amylolyticus DSM 10524]MDG5761513.1 Hsp20/alpha crystallin family protein [Natronococcus sp. A-GB1]